MDNNLLNQIITISNDGIILLNSKLEIVIYNKFIEKASGIKYEDAIQKNIFVLFPEIKNQRLETCINRALTNKETSFLTYNINDHLFPFYSAIHSEIMKQKITISPLKVHESEKYVLIQIKDETSIFKKENLLKEKTEVEKKLNEKLKDEFKHKELIEKELLQNKKDLEEKNRILLEIYQEKNELLGIAAHDLKNPILIIKKITEDLLQTPHSLETVNYLHIIQNTASNLLGLVTNLLEINTIDSKINTQNLKIIDLVSKANDLIELHKIPAFSKRITLELQVKNQIPKFKSEETKLLQILNNYLVNAIKFSPFDSNIILSLSADKDFLYVEIIDSGPGIPAEEESKLFLKYKKLSPRPTGGESSSGLGLFIVKKISESLGYTAYYKRRSPNGSIFGLKIPNLPFQEQEYILPNISKNCKCLFIEDDHLIFKLYAKILQKMGHSTEVATDSQEAIELLEKEEYDILFVDYHLREETGPEALHKIQNHFPNRKFYPVLNTADNKLDSFDVYSKLGFKDILHKDYNKEALENIFKNFYLDTDTISKS